MNKEFFYRAPDVVAKELLGKFLVRKIGKEVLITKIVETEAYFGPEDPASRARQNGDLKLTMEMDAGTILVYGVHNNWLLNLVTGDKGDAAAVLIRALEPINFKVNLSGPGLLTKGLKINKRFHKKDLFLNKELSVQEDDCKEFFEIEESFRIRVVKDLPQKLRFCIKGNKFVSR